jgi:magnesium transporter
VCAAAVDWRQLERLMKDPRDNVQSGHAIEQLSAGGADTIAALHADELTKMVERLDPATMGRVLAEIHPRSAAALLSRVQPSTASRALAAMRPDDRVDVMEHVPTALHEWVMRDLAPAEVDEVRRLEQYSPESAGGIMTTDVVALPQHLSVDQAITELRRRRRRRLQDEQVFYVYCVDDNGRLSGVVSMRDLILSDPDTKLSTIAGKAISVDAGTDQEEVARQLRKLGYLGLPVIDADRRVLGFITADDVADVAEEEATEDIQKLGGTEALDLPYLSVGFGEMIRKRGGWLSVLFLGEMLTATAMGFFEAAIARAVVLALFVPLIISSGGNSGSQAATLIVRALALSELRIRDWWRVLGRELRTSLTLGAWLGLLGFARVVVWQRLGWVDYGPHHVLLGATIWISLIGVVTFGSVTGSMLPFLLRRLGFDPAASSAPFVATLVDVTGLVIYFGTALLILKGTLL